MYDMTSYGVLRFSETFDLTLSAIANGILCGCKYRHNGIESKMVRPKNRTGPAPPGPGKFAITDNINCIQWH